MTNNTPDYENDLYFDCPTSQSPRNDLATKPQAVDLTEQWKKGELLEGFYYVKCGWSDEVEIRYVHNGVDNWKAIVAEVPSYDEYMTMKDCAKKEFEAVEKYTKVKQLLKECKECIEWYKADCGYQDAPTNAVLTKIDEALK